MILKVLFFSCLFLVLYTYLGYPIVLRALLSLKKRKRPLTTDPEEWPEVSLLICAYNEQDIVAEKMENCRALDYPTGKLHIVWATDGTTDGTNDLLAEYPDAEVYFRPERLGKTAALNRVIPLLQTPLLVLTDANTFLNSDAIKVMVRQFQDPKVACVAGEKRIMVRTGDGLAAGGEGAYWRYESTLKNWDSQFCSTMGAAGELYAIRRSLFHPMDVNMLIDDFILSMRMVQEGYRIAYTPDAYAAEMGSANMEEEKKRKVRIAAGGLQSIWVLRGLMNPFKHGWVSFQLVSHRFLRWSLTPLALFLLFPLNILVVALHGGWFYWLALLVQCVFYLMALMRVKLPCYFFFMNANVILGVKYLIKKQKNTGAWEKAKRLNK
ncbi:MAG: glycosyltransferase family 2 protein [Bacteroidaceae bacterium]|nr:glycosyltransferase family 2 protein [Bacteroidaceae bacterium]